MCLPVCFELLSFIFTYSFLSRSENLEMTPSNLSAAVLFHISPLLLTAAAQSCSPLDDVKITFFGYPDNSPPGASLAFTQCGHSLAGGTGSYDDPITFATAINGDFNVCEIVYLPWVRKYARYEDDCEQCSKSFTLR